MKKCYYEILGIDRKATIDEIKTAYKKQAILFHPDKNKTDENAKEIFQTINEAYQVLSDPNERTWYDNHRVQILSGKEDVTAEDFEEAQLGFNIWQYFSTSCYSDENDNEQFEKPPGFGDSNTGGEITNEFYNFWLAFNTCQNFGWADVYNPKEAENRQVRRLIEKENKKSRAKERKQFNKNVQELVKFVQRRDPRWREFDIAEKSREKEMEEKKKIEKEKELEERKRLLKERREEEMKRYEEEEKLQQQSPQDVENQGEDQIILNAELFDYLCQICNKSFKSENQLTNHNQSKGHLKRVKELMKEVAQPEEIEEFEEAVQQEEQKNQTQNKSKKKRKKKNICQETKEVVQNQLIKEEDKEAIPKVVNEPKQEATKEERKLDEKSESSEDELDETEFLNFGKQQIQSEKKMSIEVTEIEELKIEKIEKEEKIKSKEAPQKEEEKINHQKEEENQKLNEIPVQKVKEKKKKEKIVQPVVQPDQNNFQGKSKNQKLTSEQMEKAECLKKIQELENKLNKIEIQAEKKNKNYKKESQPNTTENKNTEEQKESKAKVRRQRKKDEQLEGLLSCKGCKLKFDSRNKLFKHIQDSGHAAYK